METNKYSRIGNVLSWVFLIGMFIFLLIASKTVINSKKTGEVCFVDGYRFIYLTSGSMEPTIKTHGMALTKYIGSLDELKIGDIISFHVEQEDGSTVRATHRIYDIDRKGRIYTKGDNNLVIDSYPITIDNVESKVCIIFNFTAWIVNKWEHSTAGKVFLLSIAAGIIFLLMFGKGLGIKLYKFLTYKD